MDGLIPPPQQNQTNSKIHSLDNAPKPYEYELITNSVWAEYPLLSSMGSATVK